MDPFAVISDYYRPGSRAHALICSHGEAVAEKALQAADAVADRTPDRSFLFEAAVLHDIGIFLTDTPAIGCYGRHPYVCHGVLGRQLLGQRGLPRHGKVCERHVGVGISAADVRRQELPLPQRDMTPRSLEEVIVCYADKFFSKNGSTAAERTPAQVLEILARYGPDKAARFAEWLKMFKRE